MATTLQGFQQQVSTNQVSHVTQLALALGLASLGLTGIARELVMALSGLGLRGRNGFVWVRPGV